MDVVAVDVVAVDAADVAGRKQNVSRIMSHDADRASVSMHVMSCAQVGAYVEFVSEDFACPPLPSVSVSLPHASYQTCHLPVSSISIQPNPTAYTDDVLSTRHKNLIFFTIVFLCYVKIRDTDPTLVGDAHDVFDEGQMAPLPPLPHHY